MTVPALSPFECCIAVDRVIAAWEEIEAISALRLPKLLERTVLHSEIGPLNVETVLSAIEESHEPLPAYIKERKPTKYLQYSKFNDYAGLARCMLNIMRNLKGRLRTVLQDVEQLPSSKLH